MFGLPPFIIIVVAGIVGSYLASSISESLIAKEHAALAPETRERYTQHLLKLELYWRILNGLGLAAMVIGILRVFKYLGKSSTTPWGIYLLVAGIAILCLERILRAWSRAWAFSIEAKGQSIVGKAMLAAALVTVIEGGIAGGIGYYIASRATVVRSRKSTTKKKSKKKSSTINKSKISYVTEAQALKIIGKDKAYLDLLVPFDGVRAIKLKGKIMYRKDDLTSRADTFLPTMEEMRKELLKNPPQKQPSPKQKKAPDGDELKE